MKGTKLVGTKKYRFTSLAELHCPAADTKHLIYEKNHLTCPIKGQAPPLAPFFLAEKLFLSI